MREDAGLSVDGFTKIEQKILSVAFGVILFPFLCFALGAAGFLVGIPITKYHAIVAFLLTLGIPYCFHRDFSFARQAFLTTMALFVCLVPACFDNEYTMDAMVYHKVAALAMSEGWNPVWQEDFSQWLLAKGLQVDDCNESHAHFFPKGQWIVCAVMYKATGNLNAGDFANYALMFVCFAVGTVCLNKWLNCGWLMAILASGAMSFNPFACDQASTGQVDGLLGSLFTVFVLSAVAWLKTGDKRLPAFVFISILYGCNLKFTGPVYFGIIVFILSALVLLQLNHKEPSVNVSPGQWFGTMGAIALFFVLLSVHPYITNTLFYSSPVYPLQTFSGDHPKVDLLEQWYRLDDFRNATTFQRFVFSHLYGQPDYEYRKTRPHEIFVDQISFFPMRQFAMDINGFGRLFGLILILSTGLLFWMRGLDNWSLIAGILMTIVVQPHSWCGRFIPQLWIVPILIGIILYSQFSESNIKGLWFSVRMHRLCGTLICALLCYGLFVFTVTQLKFVAIACMDMEFSEIVEKSPGGTLMGTFPAWGDSTGEDIYFAGRTNWLNYYLGVLIRDNQWSASVLPRQSEPRRHPAAFYNLYVYYPPEVSDSFDTGERGKTKTISTSGINAQRACYLLKQRALQRWRQLLKAWRE